VVVLDRAIVRVSVDVIGLDLVARIVWVPLAEAVEVLEDL
jgi:hypothetical protein